MTTAPHEPIYASVAKPWLKYYDASFIGQPLPDCTTFEYLYQQNKQHLNEPALEYFGRKITYADLFVNIKKTAAAFRAIGLKKGDIATVVSIMTPEIIYAFYAADLIGATLNLVDPRYSVEGIHDYIAEVDSHLLICLNVTYDRCVQAAKRTHVERILVVSPADSLSLPMAMGYKLKNPDKNHYSSNVIHWKDFIAGGQGQSTAADPVDPMDHACVVVHTGGTTGSPKGVMLTDRNFNTIAKQFKTYEFLCHRGQTLMNIMPPFIAYGFACGIHLPLTLGIKVVIVPNADASKLGSLVLKYKPQHMFGVPTHYQQLATDPRLKNKDLSFIRMYAAGGDAISVGAEENVNEFLSAHNVEFPMAKGYGMTEVSSAATAAAASITKPGSAGIPLVDTIVSVFEPGTAKELPIGEQGEICICSESIMKGYYHKPEETAAVKQVHPDGRTWVHTGDVGYIDEDGFVFVGSRIKRLIIRPDGFKVFPSMIENAISHHPAVRQCSVVGCVAKDHPQGRLPFVFVVLDPAAADKKRQILRELRQLCVEELPEYVQPVAYKFISEMPLTPVGKVDYRKLEDEISPRDY